MRERLEGDVGGTGSAADFRGLTDHRYCQLVSFRRNGAAVPTPVWFAVAGSRLYVKTETPSGKVRRIRHDPRVQVAPCTLGGRRLGAAVEGRARVLESWEAPLAERTLRGRYGLGRRLFGFLIEPIFRLRGLAPAYLEVVPAAEAT
jgi:PPOX class probable F420-dependent enzyme